MNDLLSGSLEGILDQLTTHSGVNDQTRQILENLVPKDVISDLMIKDESGEHAVEVIVAKHKTDASNETGELVHSTTSIANDVAMEDQIEDMVKALTDAANE